MSIIGVGLLGGSIGLAAKAFIKGCNVIGYGHRPQTLQRALQVGAIDQAADNLGKAVESADLVVLCTPVGLFGTMLRGISDHLTPGTLVTDVGSTKRSVIELADHYLSKTTRFVASHPMAGSEKRGVEYARADLFQNALCIITPKSSTPLEPIEQIESFWSSLGMRTCRMSPADHDQALADISHLPHTVAAALVEMQSDVALKLAGKGFLDTTRIAGGDGALWRDIFLDNADNMRDSLKRLRIALDNFEALLDPKNADALRQWLDRAAARREQLVQAKLREITPD